MNGNEDMTARLGAKRVEADGTNNVSEALEERRSEMIEESQSAKSARAVIDEIKTMLRRHPEMGNKEIALEVGATPKQVAAQRYMMSDKGKAAEERRLARMKGGEAIAKAVQAAIEEKSQEAAEGEIKAVVVETNKEAGEGEKPEIKLSEQVQSTQTAPEAIAAPEGREVTREMILDAANALCRIAKVLGRAQSCDVFVCADSVRLSVLFESGEAVG